MNQDPIDALRQAWKNENQALPPEELQLTDEATQKTVKALQEVWNSQMQVPTPAVDLNRLAKHMPRPVSKLRRRLQFVAVATFAAAAGLLLWLAPTKEPAQVPQRSGSQMASAEIDEATPTTDKTLGSYAPVVRHLKPNEIVHRPDGIELISGSVRLVLVQPTQPSPSLEMSK